MAWDDNYNDRTALRGTVTTFTTSPDGAPAAWIHNGESAEQQTTNRPVDAIAANCDLMRDALGDETDSSTFKALTQVAVLSTFSGNTITINPLGTGGGVDIDFSSAGYLYVGNSSYSGAGQEDYNTLFQFLDEDYNEVMVDGVEVVVNAISPTSLGSGFYNSGTVTLGLNKSVPSGNYRLSYARETTLGDLPDDALIRADIRGLHEAAAESGFKGAYILDANNTAPCDFSGATALQDALNVVGSQCTLFLRPGTYNLAEVGGGALSIGEVDVRIIGSGTNTTNGTILVVDSGSAHNFTLGGNHLEGVVVKAASAGQYMAVGDFGTIIDCYIENLYLYSTFTVNHVSVERVHMSSTDGRLIYHEGNEWSFRNCKFDFDGTTSTDPAVYIGPSARGITFDECAFEVQDDANLQPAIKWEGSSRWATIFRNCTIEAGAGSAFVYGNGTNCPIARLEGCYISNKPSQTVGDGVGPIRPHALDTPPDVQLSLANCNVQSWCPDTWYTGPFVQLLAQRELDADDDTNGSTGFIHLSNVWFSDDRCKGTDTTVNPPSTTTGTTPFPVMKFDNVTGESVLFERAVSYDVQDSEWLYMDNTVLTNLKIVYTNCINGPREIDTGLTASHPPFIYVGGGSHIRNLILSGVLGKGSSLSNPWRREIIEIRGDGTASVLGQPGAVVEGFEIGQTNATGTSDPYAWYFDNSTVFGIITIQQHAELSRFKWSYENGLANTLGPDSLIRMWTTSRLYDSYIYLGNTNPTVTRHIVRLENTNVFISSNRFRVTDAGGADHAMHSFITDAGSLRLAAKILNNDMSCVTSNPLNAAGIFVDLAASDECIITGNRMTGIDNSTPATYVECNSTDYVATGNILENTGTGGSPSMNPTPAGNSANLFI